MTSIKTCKWKREAENQLTRYIFHENCLYIEIWLKRSTILEEISEVPKRERQSMRQTWLILAFLPIIWSVGLGVENWQRHHTNDEVKRIMDDVHEKCPEFTRVYSLPDLEHSDVPKETVNGSKLWVIQFSKTPGHHQLGKNSRIFL